MWLLYFVLIATNPDTDQHVTAETAIVTRSERDCRELLALNKRASGEIRSYHCEYFEPKEKK